jgi:uncharacterized damage-inducible protein DinB
MEIRFFNNYYKGIMKRFIETWKVNNFINLALLECIDDDHFNDQSSQRNDKLMEQFAHMYHVRMLWLDQNTPELVTELARVFPQRLHKQSLLDALSKSGAAMTKMIEKKFTEGKINGFKTPIEFLNYIVSYESQSRNKIVLMVGFMN